MEYQEGYSIEAMCEFEAYLVLFVCFNTVMIEIIIILYNIYKTINDKEVAQNTLTVSCFLCFCSILSDIRLRVRAEYCQHESALQGNVFSNKQEAVERQFERFNQANTILKSRDLGSIICDIKFSELTYLDAFWRDYINGSLLEALKGVFITDSLKQAVGHEAIKLLVNVDEEDYQAGRRKLLRNLVTSGGSSAVGNKDSVS